MRSNEIIWVNAAGTQTMYVLKDNRNNPGNLFLIAASMYSPLITSGKSKVYLY